MNVDKSERTLAGEIDFARHGVIKYLSRAS